MKAFDIMKASQIACCFEVGSFKPGNVHKNRDYDDIKYHHFISSGIAFGDVIHQACLEKNNIGNFIKKGVIESKKWSPTNANLGIIMLHMPIAIAASNLDKFSESALKKETEKIIKNTTVQDAIDVYGAIEIALAFVNAPENGPDLKSKDAKDELIEKNLTLYDVFKISSTWDSISNEWTENFKISYKGYNLIKEYYEKYNNINIAVTKTFINLLSNYPDTLIARKKGIDVSKMVSEKAKEVLNNFNEESVLEFDKFLSKEGNKLNPGTTADLIASSLLIFLLDRISNEKTILY
ncbi:triphosphoribosyl-dephospho-CoA synthase [Methanococcus maripaludis]|jgi:triphosphoribosyl-dephospho-CoA synthase|uniref:Triphosphoribosyl-dephospho-CoA synthase n=1 Tax=Methanococcus maripaludis TaxID=39152 RepID=A0A7J9NKR2_METMI|nr:triphosphoribosyl-dephospho-CoA synthase [Methanococcus maripaludis]MBA2846017.1 triphosphoribosyl-dephospho-CoA synthase [Methanococcus maripaludis]MBA2851250.1 triphosphoribosyl-dephospho-CoA synthase [Methanococcus maripaludis]MBB6068147.1 triphosphoribosyl-dephospho-CoA synthase [Methanococcus maripaludis]MBM7409958.1 triphosphoribosyl-dephospho-CoA synthase [Methanococcus maripaludis]MBP2219288.1 triphosphoribosyl-dephospho-CoA synthase [Methanococcus maripaludis]